MDPSLLRAQAILFSDTFGLELVGDHRLIEHKFLVEPGSSISDPRHGLDDLRFVTVELGGTWPYHSPFNRRVPGALQDLEEDEDERTSHPHNFVGSRFSCSNASMCRKGCLLPLACLPLPHRPLQPLRVHGF